MLDQATKVGESINREDAKEFYNPEIKRAKELTNEIKQKTEIVKRERV